MMEREGEAKSSKRELGRETEKKKRKKDRKEWMITRDIRRVIKQEIQS